MKGKISKIKNTKGELALPITTVEAIYMEDGITKLSDEMKDVLKYEEFDNEDITAEIPSVKEEINGIKENISEINSSLENKANLNEVVKKGYVNLNDCDSQMLSAIQGGEGTNFELLSIPRDGSVTVEKIDNSLLNVIADFEKYNLNYELGAINTVGTLNNNVSNRWRTSSFIHVCEGFKIINNALKDVVMYFYDSEVASNSTLIERIVLTKGTSKSIDNNSYLLVDLLNNTLEEGANVHIEYIAQKEVKNSSVTIEKLANDTIKLIDTKSEKTELLALKQYIEDLFIANGLFVNTVDIPDKYNTGIPSFATLDVAPKENFYKFNLQFNYKIDSGYAERPSDGKISINVDFKEPIKNIENMDFTSSFVFELGNEIDGVERVIYFKNCKFNFLKTGKRNDINITYVFNNCEIGTFSGSRCTFNNCKIGGMPYDGTNPFRYCYFNNCFITNLSPDETYPWNNSLHLDGTQIFGWTDVENTNIEFINCRFECLPLPRSNSTVYINACLMLSLDYNNAKNILFKDCILNGGGYSIYLQNKEYEFENVTLDNIRIGCSSKYGTLYKNETSGVNYNNVRETDTLYVGSVWKDEKGIHISVSNDTNIERILKLVTNNNEYTFIIPKCLTYNEMIEDVTVYSDFPFDIEKIINDNSRWIKIYDVTDRGNEKLIKLKVLES